MRNKAAPVLSAPLQPSQQETLQGLIALQFERLAMSPTFQVSSSSAFSKRVVKTDYSFGMEEEVSLRCLIAGLLEQGKETLVLLDLGAGSGIVPHTLMKEFKGKLVSYGLDAKELSALPKELQIIGDIENLQEIEMLKKMHFDIVASSGVFDHLIDPAEALQKAYALLPEDGYLLVDRMRFIGLEEYGPSLIYYFRQQGYCVAAECAEGHDPVCAYTALVFRKTHSTLVLPFHIDPLNPIQYGKARYEAENALKEEDLKEELAPFHHQLERLFIAKQSG